MYSKVHKYLILKLMSKAIRNVPIEFTIILYNGSFCNPQNSKGTILYFIILYKAQNFF